MAATAVASAPQTRTPEPPASRDVKPSPRRAATADAPQAPLAPAWRPLGSWGLAGAAPVNLVGQGNGLKLILQCLTENVAGTRPDVDEAQRHLDAVAAELLRDAPEFRQYREAKKQFDAAKKAHAEALVLLDEQVKEREELLTVMPGGLADKLALADKTIAEARSMVASSTEAVTLLSGVRDAKAQALKTRLGTAEVEAIQRVRGEQQKALEEATAAFVAQHADELTNLARLAQTRTMKASLSRLSADILGD
ncbi:MAG: hypothetical protein KGL39_29690 [Patescibacteria group bacterium]|nr:hypothetical protein [Patescibacteria group bacterium]